MLSAGGARFRFVAAVAAVVAMAACGRGARGGMDGAPDALWGRKFVSADVSEGGEPRPLVSGTRIELTFEKRGDGGVVRWDAACNIIGSEVEITADRLLLEELSGTSEGCPDELVPQEEWVAGFFGSDPHWELNDDRLTLTSDMTVIQFEEGAHGT